MHVDLEKSAYKELSCSSNLSESWITTTANLEKTYPIVENKSTASLYQLNNLILYWI